jgi:hypothetical protein
LHKRALKLKLPLTLCGADLLVCVLREQQQERTEQAFARTTVADMLERGEWMYHNSLKLASADTAATTTVSATSAKSSSSHSKAHSSSENYPLALLAASVSAYSCQSLTRCGCYAMLQAVFF